MSRTIMGLTWAYGGMGSDGSSSEWMSGVDGGGASESVPCGRRRGFLPPEYFFKYDVSRNRMWHKYNIEILF
jgi:hypothetical protein